MRGFCFIVFIVYERGTVGKWLSKDVKRYIRGCIGVILHKLPLVDDILDKFIEGITTINIMSNDKV